jgi:hypothetical protein
MVSNQQGLSKPNSITDKFQRPLYHGRFDGFSMFLRSSLLDANEKLTIGWRDDERVRWNPSHWQDTMPFMTKYTEKMHDLIGSITFNTSYPGSLLNHHWGLDQSYLRLHLCLDEADGCVFDIEGWKHQWRDGDLFGFDDANVLHGTSHSGTKPRTVLIIDVWKSVIRKYATSWPCRDQRPDPGTWNEIMANAGIYQA